MSAVGATGGAQPYAKCNDCGVELKDRTAVNKHGQETLTPTGATTGLTATGHQVRIVNPTPEERQSSLVRSTIASALDDFYDEMDRHVQRNLFTEAEFKEQLAWFDLADGWDEYIAEGE